MASKQPIVKQIAWASVGPQVMVMAFLICASYLLGASRPILVGALVYLTVSISLRNLVPSHHRRGIRYLKKREFAKAAEEFQLSCAFFQEHPWLDRFRFIVLLSSSRISYREMALLNLAYCSGQLGDGAQAKEYYEKAVREFPDSQIAKSSLRMLKSAEGQLRDPAPCSQVFDQNGASDL